MAKIQKRGQCLPNWKFAAISLCAKKPREGYYVAILWACLRDM